MHCFLSLSWYLPFRAIYDEPFCFNRFHHFPNVSIIYAKAFEEACLLFTRHVDVEKFSHCVLHYTISIIKLDEEIEFLSIDFINIYVASERTRERERKRVSNWWCSFVGGSMRKCVIHDTMMIDKHNLIGCSNFHCLHRRIFIYQTTFVSWIDIYSSSSAAAAAAAAALFYVSYKIADFRQLIYHAHNLFHTFPFVQFVWP